MSEDHPSTPPHRSWFERLTQALSGEPRNVEELLEELRQAQANGLLSNDTLSMVEGAIEVTDLTVADVMVPRAQMVSLPLGAPLQEILARVIESGHSRFPVHGDDKDEIVGILLAKDLLRCFTAAEPCDISRLLRPVALIPESKKLNILLKEFRLSRNHMAVVVDEYGGVAGLITIEDVIEQVIGKIDDEYDVEDDQSIRDEGEGRAIVKGATRIDEFNAHFGTQYADDAFDTIAGLVMQQFGRLPRRGESVAIDDHTFQVLRMDRRRIETLRVTPP